MSVLKWEAPNTWSAEVILALAPTTTAVTSSSVGLGSTGLVLAAPLVLTPTSTATNSTSVVPTLALQAPDAVLVITPSSTNTLVGNNATVYLYSGTPPVIPEEDTRPTPTLIAMAIITVN